MKPAWVERILWGIACAAMLSACGGGSDSPAPAGTTPTQAPLSYHMALTPTAGQVATGSDLALQATVVDSNGQQVASPGVQWTSSDTSLATLTSDPQISGLLSLHGNIPGTLTVTAKAVAPDGSALSQSASVKVVQAAALTYALHFANPALALQWNRPTWVAAHLVRSDGTDVTAFATGWQWSVDHPASVGLTSAGELATLTAVNSSTTVSQSATVSVSATAPDGTLLSGQIAVTALPDYVYNIVFSQSSVTVSSDLPATVTAKVMRSDGVDVTPSFTGWTWYTPANQAGAGQLSVATANGGTTATLSSSLVSGVQTSGGSYQNTYQVSATGPDPYTSITGAASLLVTQVPAYAFYYQPLASPSWGTQATLHAHIFHDGDPSSDITASCTNWSWVVTGATVSSGSSADMTFTPSAASFSMTPNCMVNGQAITGPTYTGMTAPLTISNFTVTLASPTSALAQWTTDVPSTSQAICSNMFTGEICTSALDSTLVTSHSVTVTGLVSGTVYRFQASSVDSAGRQVTSAGTGLAVP